MKLLCKLFGHKWEMVKQIGGGDYQKYIEKCKRCDKTVIATYNSWGWRNLLIVDRSDLDESENL